MTNQVYLDRSSSYSKDRSFSLLSTQSLKKGVRIALWSFVVGATAIAFHRMQAILSTGSDPGRKVLAKKILDQMPADMIDILAEAIHDHNKPNPL